MQTQTFQAVVLKPSFLGKGVEGSFYQKDEIVEVELEIAEKDVLGADGEVKHKAGEPVYGDNLQLVEGQAVETIPAGLPQNAKPTGVPGVYMVPIDGGERWEVWQPGDPTTALASRSPEEFRAGNPDLPTIAEDLEAKGLGALDHDGDGKPGGSLSKAELKQALDDRGVSYPATATASELRELLAAPPV